MRNGLLLLSMCFFVNLTAQKNKTSITPIQKAQYLMQLDSIDTEIGKFNCPQLSELLNIKQQQLSNVLNDIQIFTKFIDDLNEEKAISNEAYDKALKNIILYENRYERVSDILYRCIARGGSQNGECLREEKAYLETHKKLQEYRAQGKLIRQDLQAILDDLKTYVDLRENASQDSRRLRSEVIRIELRMQRLGCT